MRVVRREASCVMYILLDYRLLLLYTETPYSTALLPFLAKNSNRIAYNSLRAYIIEYEGGNVLVVFFFLSSTMSRTMYNIYIYIDIAYIAIAGCGTRST